MKRTPALSILVVVVLLTVAVTTEAQQPTTIPRIGFLSGGSASGPVGRTEALSQGLRKLGYEEGKSIVIEQRYAEGKPDRVPVLAAELVRLKVAIIVSSGAAPTRAAKAATATIPIVTMNEPDPVGTGVVASLSRPGGNITGVSTLAPELSGKRLEILREVVPKFSRVAVLGTSTSVAYRPMSKEIELAAKALSVEVQNLDILVPKDIETAFRSATKGRADGALVIPNPILGVYRTLFIELAAKNRLPVMYHQLIYVEAGGLMYYGVNTFDLDRRAATYVDKILKGAKPADLPVEQPTKFEFVVNLKSARQMGLTIPPNVLVRADRVIK